VLCIRGHCSFQLGRLLGSVGNWSDATPELLRAVELNASCWSCRLAAGEALSVAGKLEQSELELAVRACRVVLPARDAAGGVVS
jgi:hypothetical protein